MSDARRGSFASRKARGEVGGGGGAPKSSRTAKEHNYDATRYHQNANRHGIRALRTFDCPVCDSKNTIRVTLTPRLGQGTVTCTYCALLRPVPVDLPYPSVQKFVPSLENKADVFFRFHEQYAALLRQHADADQVPLTTAHSSSSSALLDGSRRRPREEATDGEGHAVAGGLGRRARGEGSAGDAVPRDGTLHGGAGLFGDGAGGYVMGVMGMSSGDDDDDGGDANDGDSKCGVQEGSAAEGRHSASATTHDGVDSGVAALADEAEDGAEEMDVAEFFADSD
ncbi:Transcription elongation factor 1 domain-containing protein [Novymonas esmeraldas]|uniref:Transcription elongation factor 1 domain-containing protein n=1 Tax=Novymonas esmeraldas TaxID=1808958 RepID=A0AAW0EQR4_9TRYP